VILWSLPKEGGLTVRTEWVVCIKMCVVTVGTEGGGSYMQYRVGGVQQVGVVTFSTEWVVCNKMWDVRVGSECISCSKQGAVQSVESGWCAAGCGTLQSERSGWSAAQYEI